MHRIINHCCLILLFIALFFSAVVGAGIQDDNASSADVVVVGATPGGIMASIAAGRLGCSVVLLERSEHIGGLPANGLGATDIGTRGATGGLFLEFVGRIRKHYEGTYGSVSPQLEACSDGYHFEPRVAEQVFSRMLAEVSGKVTALTMKQFDAEPSNVLFDKGIVSGVRILNRENGEIEIYRGKVLIDATYEGDLAAAAGADFRIGRESWAEFNEPMSGILYKPWGGEPGPCSSGLGDNAVQAYNFRLCLTDDLDNAVLFEKPEGYDREEYASLITDIKERRFAAIGQRGEMAIEGIGRITNMVRLPNSKTDANNQHAAFLSTDLPEENWPWPTSGWVWRDRFAERLREYTQGLFWFMQNDPELPEDFRQKCRLWGKAADEYQDNNNFPRQVYVREGRRIEGEYLFTAHDAIPVKDGLRPPLHLDSITASHYALDSHAVRKREEGRPHLDGFFSYPSQPYLVPYGVMLPKGLKGLLAPVPVSGTHIGFSTLRMEPCWMAMGQAAGIAAALSCQTGVSPHDLKVRAIQEQLIKDGAVLMYFRDIGPDDRRFKPLQKAAVQGFFGADEWEARLDEPLDRETQEKGINLSGTKMTIEETAGRTRGVFL
ncbi:MAG: FAD-dependent oxidoreductase, partial [Acidobacteriota bacterium]